MPSNRTFQMRDRQFRVFAGFNAPRLRSVARYGGKPCPNIFRRGLVCITFIAALLTAEMQALPVGYPPEVSISEMANALKGNIYFVARRNCKEKHRKKLWWSAFWSPSFLAASCVEHQSRRSNPAFSHNKPKSP